MAIFSWCFLSFVQISTKYCLSARSSKKGFEITFCMYYTCVQLRAPWENEFLGGENSKRSILGPNIVLKTLTKYCLNTLKNTAKTPVQRWWQHRYHNVDNASTTMAKMPAWQGQQGCHCSDDKDTPKIPSWWGRQCQQDMGNNVSMTMFGGCHHFCCHHHHCQVVFVVFSKAKKKLVLEFGGDQ